MTTPRILTLRIEASGESIQGALGDEAGASREFRGWLGLARALELTLAARPAPQMGASRRPVPPRPAPRSIPPGGPPKRTGPGS